MAGNLNAHTGILFDTLGFHNNIPELQDFSDICVLIHLTLKGGLATVINTFGRIVLQFTKICMLMFADDVALISCFPFIFSKHFVIINIDYNHL